MQQEPVAEYTKVESIFVRHRNCLMLKGQFTPIFTDYYLHLLDLKEEHKENLDTALKDLLAVLTLHLTSRPWAETHAWTVNLRAPRVNFFATGSSVNENIVGKVFTKDVREPDRNLLYAQVIDRDKGGDPQLSTVEVPELDPCRWVEAYYEQSDQRPARCFKMPNEEYVLIAAQPDFDEEWLNELDEEKVAQLLQVEETKVLETRKYKFECGCSIERIMPGLLGYKDKLDELFQNDDQLAVNCPRCGTKYELTRELILDFAKRVEEARKQAEGGKS
ncbi:Hsp33 family molecular chaperone HslO [Persicirhabdus sediminis]|uniref:Hsp33 family molecular chaperone HslO n=1 Tax=Persicirhabdus sediminis TaxID=454144 RepID=A0A8J7SI45_9BACT|nr:Hsp33 family molecular chaperone HslO [Persicirhabdus sediminis]